MPRASKTAIAALACGLLAAAPAAQEANANERVEKWPSGNVRERYTVDEQGNKHGNFERWSDSGVRVISEVYSHGKLHGMHREWTETGTLICQMSFQDDLPDGSFETFHEERAAGDERQLPRRQEGRQVDRDRRHRRNASALPSICRAS
jgi:antitoxin component YwqK of YwqJK toxin-antitoxin module